MPDALRQQVVAPPRSVAALLLAASCAAAPAAPAGRPPAGEPASLAASDAGDVPRPEPDAAPSALVWEREPAGALARARRERRRVLVLVTASWSAASRALERDLASDPRLARAARTLVCLRIDVSAADGPAEADAARFGARRVPAVVLLDPDARVLGSLQGPASAAAVMELIQPSSSAI